MQLGREASGTTGNVLPWPVLAASPLLLTFRSVCITPRSDTGQCQQQTCPAVSCQGWALSDSAALLSPSPVHRGVPREHPPAPVPWHVPAHRGWSGNLHGGYQERVQPQADRASEIRPEGERLGAVTERRAPFLGGKELVVLTPAREGPGLFFSFRFWGLWLGLHLGLKYHSVLPFQAIYAASGRSASLFQA